jgi:hypothetical protein
MAEIVALTNEQRQRQQDFRDAIAQKQYELYELTGHDGFLRAIKWPTLQ